MFIDPRKVDFGPSFFFLSNQNFHLTTIDNPICELGVSLYTLTYVGWAKALSGHALARPLPCAQGQCRKKWKFFFFCYICIQMGIIKWPFVLHGIATYLHGIGTYLLRCMYLFA